MLWKPIVDKAQVVEVKLISKMDYKPQYELWDGSKTMLMGYGLTLSGDIDLPSPTLTFKEGDSVKLVLRNMSQPAPHTIHLHGLDVDQENDGVPQFSWVVKHAEEKPYHFVAPHAGTYLYHCHIASSLHVQAGMWGLLIVRPADDSNTTWDGGYPYTKDYGWITSELDTTWHTDDVINHDFDDNKTPVLDFYPQYFLINGKGEHQLKENESIAVNAEIDDVVYLRLANMGFYGNKFTFPAELNAKIVSSDGRPLPEVEISNTLDVFPGERYGVLIQSQALLDTEILVDYFNLNTFQTENTQSVGVTITNKTDIEDDQLNKQHIIVYPVPADKLFHVVLPEQIKSIDKIEVVSVNGSLMKSIPKGDTGLKPKLYTFDASSWAKGVYFVKVHTQNRIFTRKLIVP